MEHLANRLERLMEGVRPWKTQPSLPLSHRDSSRGRALHPDRWHHPSRRIVDGNMDWSERVAGRQEHLADALRQMPTQPYAYSTWIRSLEMSPAGPDRKIAESRRPA